MVRTVRVLKKENVSNLFESRREFSRAKSFRARRRRDSRARPPGHSGKRPAPRRARAVAEAQTARESHSLAWVTMTSAFGLFRERKRRTYLPVRGREALDGGGQASGGEPDGFRAELFIGKRHAKHVERVHLRNVHALALAASHLAAADVLAVVALRDFSENTRCARVSRSRVGRRNDAKRLEKVYDDDEKRRENKKKGLFPRARGTARSWPGCFLFDSADGHPHCASVEGARFSSQPPNCRAGKRGEEEPRAFLLCF